MFYQSADENVFTSEDEHENMKFIVFLMKMLNLHGTFSFSTTPMEPKKLKIFIKLKQKFYLKN